MHLATEENDYIIGSVKNTPFFCKRIYGNWNVTCSWNIMGDFTYCW